MLTEQQSEFLSSDQSTVVIGKPGTGKTYAMISKIEALLHAGVKPSEIAVLAFSLRSLSVLKTLIRNRLGDVVEDLKLGTLRDFSMNALERVQNESPMLAEHSLVRRYLRQAMNDVGFKGTVQEAEHIMRQFKGRGQKPQGKEAYYNLFLSYKAILDQNHIMDRHDVVRKHIIGMRNDVLQPVDVKYLFVDNVQDATQIQLLWFVDHHQAGVKVFALGDDDLCVYGQDGAIGAEALQKLADNYEFKQIMFAQQFRYGLKLERLSDPLLMSVQNRIEKPVHISDKLKTEVELQHFADENIEEAFVLERVEEFLRKFPKERIGVIVRHDLQGRKLERLLRESCHGRIGFLGRSLWEMPAALAMFDLLEVLLNQANNAQLKNVLMQFGVPSGVLDNLFVSGLNAHNWLVSGGFNAQEVLPENQAESFDVIQHQFLTYYMAMEKVGVKSVFKACAYDLLEQMDDDDKLDALHALDQLLHIKGKVSQSLKMLKNSVEPNPLAQVVLASAREIRNLEFDHVIMPYLKRGIYPYPYKVLGENIESERRLFYSAMTRAKKKLVLCHAGEASPYLKEIEELI